MKVRGKSLLAVSLLTYVYIVSAAEPRDEPQMTVHVTDKMLLREMNLGTPISVQVPVSIAAAVCGKDAAELAELARSKSMHGCEARTTNPHFNFFVRRQAAESGIPIN